MTRSKTHFGDAVSEFLLYILGVDGFRSLVMWAALGFAFYKLTENWR